jgi:hypothetical protein
MSEEKLTDSWHSSRIFLQYAEMSKIVEIDRTGLSTVTAPAWTLLLVT